MAVSSVSMRNCFLEFFLFISLIVAASRLIESQMDLPHLLFGMGFQTFIVMPQMFRFS